jgi:hypothetical protein
MVPIILGFGAILALFLARSGDSPMTLANQLLQIGYAKLFFSGDPAPLEQIWTRPDAPAQLRNLALEPTANPEARFLAAEVLFHKQPSPFSSEESASLAEVYAEALKTATIGNYWGLPGSLSAASPSAQHLVSLGDVMIKPLLALLEDARIVPYEGSEEATVGNSYQYRIKDVAAFFIAKIKNIPYAVHQDPARRDQQIDELKKQLPR